MRTLDQINEDIDAQLTTHEALSRREHELDMLGSTQDQRVELRAARRRNDTELLLARQERSEFNLLRSLAADAVDLFDAKLRQAAAYRAYCEAVRECERTQYDGVGTRTTAKRAAATAHTELCAAAQHLHNVRTGYEAHHWHVGLKLAEGRQLRAEEAARTARAA